MTSTQKEAALRTMADAAVYAALPKESRRGLDLIRARRSGKPLPTSEENHVDKGARVAV